MRLFWVFWVVFSSMLFCSSSVASENLDIAKPEQKGGSEIEVLPSVVKQQGSPLVKAKNVDLNQPISEQEIVAPGPSALESATLKSEAQNSVAAPDDKSPISENTFVNGQEPTAAAGATMTEPLNNTAADIGSPTPDLVEWEGESTREKTILEDATLKDNAGVPAKTRDNPLVVNSTVKKESKTPFVLLGTEVPPGTSTRLAWSPHQSFEGIYSATPVLVVNGMKAGPTLCLTASIHGDELNGVETVRRVLYNLEADSLKGTVVGVPIVNLQSFRRGSRYLSDRRDLNRFFPGDPNGSSAARIAHSFFNEVVKHCSAIVDIHTGSFYRTNLPQLRADLTNPKVVKMTKGFGSTVVLHSVGAEGTMRRAAVGIGIPAVTLEAGAPMVLDETSVSQSVKGIHSLLKQLDMISTFSFWGTPEPAYYTSSWQRAQVGGIIFSKVKLGALVKKGDVLGTVTNPITNVRNEIISEYNGKVLGMALNQVVHPGFAAYHIGIRAPQEQISEPQEVTSTSPLESDSIETASLPLKPQNKEAPVSVGNNDGIDGMDDVDTIDSRETDGAHIESE